MEGFHAGEAAATAGSSSGQYSKARHHLSVSHHGDISLRAHAAPHQSYFCRPHQEDTKFQPLRDSTNAPSLPKKAAPLLYKPIGPRHVQQHDGHTAGQSPQPTIELRSRASLPEVAFAQGPALASPLQHSRPQGRQQEQEAVSQAHSSACSSLRQQDALVRHQHRVTRIVADQWLWFVGQQRQMRPALRYHRRRLLWAAFLTLRGHMMHCQMELRRAVISNHRRLYLQQVRLCLMPLLHAPPTSMRAPTSHSWRSSLSSTSIPEQQQGLRGLMSAPAAMRRASVCMQ